MQSDFDSTVSSSTNEISTGGISSFTVSASGVCSKVGSASSDGDAPAFMAVFSNGSEVMAMNVSTVTRLDPVLSSLTTF